MPRSKFKKLVRARCDATGESWATAVRFVRRQVDADAGDRPQVTRSAIKQIQALAMTRAQRLTEWYEAVPNHRERQQQTWRYREDSKDTHPSTARYERSRRQLIAAMVCLDDHMLMKLQAVMYVGRDGERYNPEGVGVDEHLARAYYIAGKRPLASYLARGLRRVNDAELESPLPCG